MITVGSLSMALVTANRTDRYHVLIRGSDAAGRYSMRALINITFIISPADREWAHSKLGCEISPILLESKENERWHIESLTYVNDAR